MLPEYDAVIFDEAHTLEDVAADHLGIGVSQGGVEYLLGQLLAARTQKGILATRWRSSTLRGRRRSPNVPTHETH
ncbi:hypothetical protein VT84_11160 [Gemmata sp. SH-PL17]|uniref:hypothetical protein n=1 Tax=Gemmata sp. SH-PL17 TaxID=1630693 RepID=UPI0004B692BF|nr:hypothetical protein [Gemmata sp. SH-PL17]AMV24949.1 hypothetical protein VT84_11160 [Gemmata sp. SH-PL17]